MIGIIDYGRGNLRSIENALKKMDADYMMIQQTQKMRNCDRLILPGVGAFADGMRQLGETGLKDELIEEALSGKPLLGICLGMQMLFEKSYEKGETKGLGLLKGEVVRIDDPSVPVPEIGWNELLFDQPSSLKEKLSLHPYVYYVHSYYVHLQDTSILIAHSEYGKVKVPGIVQKNHIIGTQFHPEKSSQDGLRILSWFVKEDI